MTYRLTYIDQDNERRVREKDNCTIYATWHQRFLPGVTVLAPRKPIAIMVSQSPDGEFIARIGNMFGWDTVRGSSSRRGKQALQEVKELSRRGYSIGHVVDGPKGPFGVVKPGLLSIAQATGKAILPTIFSGEKQWVFNSWDRFMLPKPFSRLIVRFGEPVYVPEKLSDTEFEALRLQVEETMRLLYEDTDKMWENGNISTV